MNELDDIKRRAGITENAQQVQDLVYGPYVKMSEAGQELRAAIAQAKEAGVNVNAAEDAWAKIGEGLEWLRRNYRL